MYVYHKGSIKNWARRRREEAGTRVHIGSAETPMPQGRNWRDLLRSSEKKAELTKFLVEFWKKNSIREKLSYAVVVTDGEDSWTLSPYGLTKGNDKCNHEEANTRLILHVSTVS